MKNVTFRPNTRLFAEPSSYWRRSLVDSTDLSPEDQVVLSSRKPSGLFLPFTVRPTKSTTSKVARTNLIPHHQRTQARLQAQSRRFSRPIAKKDVRFPEEFTGRFRGRKLGILGDGDWYHGWLSVEFRLNKLADAEGKNRFIFDPKYLNESGLVDERVIRNHGRNPQTIGEVVRSPDDFPDSTRAFILSPNRFHVSSLVELVDNPNVNSIYMEKPPAINRAQLERLARTLAQAHKPVFFGDHYLYKATGLLKLMGKESIHTDALDLRFDSKGVLARALRGDAPVLGPLKSVEAVTTFRGAENLLDGRDWLEKASLGGGVLLDLAVHQLNVLHLLGLEFEAIESAQRKVRPNGVGVPRGTFVPLDPKSDLAEDYALVQGRLEGGIPITLKVAQFEKQHVNRLSLSDVHGRKAILDYATRTVQIFEEETLIGELRCEADPVLLMMDHALHYFDSQDTEPMFYHEQKASIEVIEAIKDFDRLI